MNAAKLKEVAARMRQGGNAAYVKVNQAPAGWDDVTIRSYDFLAASVLTWADEIEAAATSPAPLRVWWLDRIEDATGVSGTGRVAVAVEFPDGVCALRWLTEHRSTAVYSSIQELEAIHLHHGATKLTPAAAPTLTARQREAVEHGVRALDWMVRHKVSFQVEADSMPVLRTLLDEPTVSPPTLTPAEERFFQAAKEYVAEYLADAYLMSTPAPESWIPMIAAYRALSPGVMETGEKK